MFFVAMLITIIILSLSYYYSQTIFDNSTFHALRSSFSIPFISLFEPLNISPRSSVQSNPSNLTFQEELEHFINSNTDNIEKMQVPLEVIKGYFKNIKYVKMVIEKDHKFNKFVYFPNKWTSKDAFLIKDLKNNKYIVPQGFIKFNPKSIYEWDQHNKSEIEYYALN